MSDPKTNMQFHFITLNRVFPKIQKVKKLYFWSNVQKSPIFGCCLNNLKIGEFFGHIFKTTGPNELKFCSELDFSHSVVAQKI